MTVAVDLHPDKPPSLLGRADHTGWGAQVPDLLPPTKEYELDLGKGAHQQKYPSQSS